MWQNYNSESTLKRVSALTTWFWCIFYRIFVIPSIVFLDLLWNNQNWQIANILLSAFWIGNIRKSDIKGSVKAAVSGLLQTPWQLHNCIAPWQHSLWDRQTDNHGDKQSTNNYSAKHFWLFLKRKKNLDLGVKEAPAFHIADFCLQSFRFQWSGNNWSPLTVHTELAFILEWGSLPLCVVHTQRKMDLDDTAWI